MNGVILTEIMIKSIMITAIGLIAGAILTGGSPSRRCTVWTAVAASLLVLPLYVTIGPKLPIFGADLSVSFLPVLGQGSALPSNPNTVTSHNGIAISQINRSSPAQSGRARYMPDLGAVVLVMWVIGILSLALAAINTKRQLRLLYGRCRPCDDDRINQTLRACAKRVGLSQAPRIRLCSSDMVPFTAGAMRPWVCLPEDAREWNKHELHVTLIHECCHIRSRHALTRTFVEASVVLNWLNPLVWIMQGRMIRDQELACDDMSLASGIEPICYVETLVCAANRRCIPFGVPAISSRPSLERRIRRVLGGAVTCQAGWSLRARATVLSVLVIFCVVLGGLPVRADSQRVERQPLPSLADDEWARTIALPDLMNMRSLSVRVHAGSISVVQSETEHNQVIVRLIYYEENGAVRRIQNPGDHVLVAMVDREMQLNDRHMNGDDRDRWQLDIEVRLSAALSIEARSTLGAVRVAAASGSVFASSGVSDVTIDLEDTVLDALESHSGIGDVRVHVGGAREVAKFSVGEGSIKASFLRVSPTTLLEMEGGEATLELRLPSTTRCVLEGSIGSGSVSFSNPSMEGLEEQSRDGGQFRRVVGDADSPRYFFACGQGQIDIWFEHANAQ